MVDNHPLPSLSKRAADLVEWLARYGVVLLPIVRDQLPDLSLDAQRKFLERLVSDGWLVRHKLPGCEEWYWVLSTQACNRLGLKRSGNPLRQAPLIRQSITASFFATNKHLHLLTAAECHEIMPSIFRRGSSNRYFLDSSNPKELCLGWVLIDDGRAPLRIWSKARQVASNKKAISALHELCLAGQFYLAVATTTAAKAAKIEKLFHERPITHVPVRVVPVMDAGPQEVLLFDKVS